MNKLQHNLHEKPFEDPLWWLHFEIDHRDFNTSDEEKIFKDLNPDDLLSNSTDPEEVKSRRLKF